MLEVRTAAKGEHWEVARVLAEAFADDPVMRWLLPAGRRYQQLFHVLARYRRVGAVRRPSGRW